MHDVCSKFASCLLHRVNTPLVGKVDSCDVDYETLSSATEEKVECDIVRCTVRLVDHQSAVHLYDSPNDQSTSFQFYIYTKHKHIHSCTQRIFYLGIYFTYLLASQLSVVRQLRDFFSTCQDFSVHSFCMNVYSMSF